MDDAELIGIADRTAQYEVWPRADVCSLIAEVVRLRRVICDLKEIRDRIQGDVMDISRILVGE
jgi:hypothetical protein